jgi:hypothetical protein
MLPFQEVIERAENRKSGKYSSMKSLALLQIV